MAACAICGEHAWPDEEMVAFGNDVAHMDCIAGVPIDEEEEAA